MKAHPSHVVALVIELDALLRAARNVQISLMRGDHRRVIIDSALADLCSARTHLAGLEDLLHRELETRSRPPAAQDLSEAPTREHKQR